MVNNFKIEAGFSNLCELYSYTILPDFTSLTETATIAFLFISDFSIILSKLFAKVKFAVINKS